MAKHRKTIPVAEVIELLNKLIADYPIGVTEIQKEQYRNVRHGIAVALATVLHKTNNYAGFSYLDEKFEKGKTDESRVQYITTWKLRK